MLTRLNGYSEGAYGPFYEYNPLLHRVVHQHMTYADFLALPESRLGYRTAAFVRNPYDRAYSGFIQLQRDLKNQPHMPFQSAAVRELVMRQLSDNAAQIVTSGYDFDRWFAQIPDYEVLEAGRNTSFPLHPAHYWTDHGGEQAVDFVGRVENFEVDFATMCGRLGISTESRENVNVSCEDFTDDGCGYRYVSRMSRGSIAKINRLFAEDFIRFGYEMIDPDHEPAAGADGDADADAVTVPAETAWARITVGRDRKRIVRPSLSRRKRERFRI